MSGENSIFFDLIERLGAVGRPTTDPTVVACEAAAIAVALYRQGSITSEQTISTATEYLPRWATPMIHGVTAGIVGMLVTETQPVPATLEIAAPDHSLATLMARFGIDADQATSDVGYATRVVSGALAVQPFEMESSMGQAIEAVAAEDENFHAGIVYDLDFRNTVFGLATGMALALSTEVGA